MKQVIQERLGAITLVMIALWAVFAIDWLIPYDFCEWGLRPRQLDGLPGIAAMPLLHANVSHLFSNSVPLFILLFLLCSSRKHPWLIVAAISLLGGGLLWLFGRSFTHVGASLVVYGLIAFLVVAGFAEKRIVPMLIAFGVLFLYGGVLLFGVLPTAGREISWDGHLTGAVSGAILALVTTRDRQQAVAPSSPLP